MMQFAQNYNPMQNIDPTGAMVSQVGRRVTGALGNFFEKNATWQAQKAKVKNDTEIKADVFTGAVRLLHENGIDPKMAALPDFEKADMTPETYAEKVGTQVHQAFIIKNLETEGADTSTLRKTMAFPDTFKQQAETLKKGITTAKITDLTKKISGGYGPEVYKAVMDGQMSPADISARYGVKMDQQTYDQIAGHQPPQPLGGFTPEARKAAMAQPMGQQEAMEKTSIAQPLPLGAAQREIASSGLDATQTAHLQPLVAQAGARQTADIFKGMEKPTEAGLYAGKLGAGEAVDESAKALGGALRAEQEQGIKRTAQEKKDDYNRMRQQEQKVSLLKAYMQNWKDRKTFEKEYGDRAWDAAEKMGTLVQEKLNIENQIVQAENWTDYENPAPDVMALREKARAYDNEITRLMMEVPKLNDLAEKLGRAPTELTPPAITPIPSPPKPDDLRQQAKDWLSARGNKNPTPEQIQKVMVKMQDKMNER
jgi:hypothetical protein